MKLTGNAIARTAFAALAVVWFADPAIAQQASPGPTSAAPAAQRIDADRLPLDLHRIERQLRQSVVREEHDGLNLRYTVDVYGQAPRLELFSREDNLASGPVPYGGPTHRDMLDVMTPKEYRAPAADFGSLMRWLQEKLKN